MTSMEVSEFEALRQHLMSVAYRLTGTVADAEDIVQEAWLRWDSQDTVIADPRAWLTTVVSRLGLDKLRSAAHRRETYTGTWLPEPDDAAAAQRVAADRGGGYHQRQWGFTGRGNLRRVHGGWGGHLVRARRRCGIGFAGRGR